MVLEKTLENPLDCKEIQPVHPKGDESWVFTGRIDVKAEAPILWPPDAKSWLIWKDPDAEKDWGQEEKGMTEDEMVGWHYWLNGHKFGWTLGVGDGQGGLVCCGSWGHKELDTTERLNWTEVMSSSLWPHRPGPARLLCPWNFPGRNTGVGCHVLRQGIFSTQGSNSHLFHFLHQQAGSLPLESSLYHYFIESKPVPIEVKPFFYVWSTH